MDTSQPQQPSFRIRLFGKLEILIDGSPLPKLHSRNEHLLLTLLALEGGRPIQRNILAARLWPPDAFDEYRAESNLRRSLYNLRKALGTQVFRLPDASQMARTLELDLTDAEVDVLAFDRLIAKKQPEDLQRAVAIYQGPLLEEYSETKITTQHPGWLWILEERRKRQRAFRDAITELSIHVQVFGTYDDAIQLLQRAIEIESSWQAGHRLLMEILAKSGNTKQALQIFERLRQRLNREYGETPEPDLIALANHMRSAAHTKPPSTPPKSDKPSQGYLPIPLTSFIGRQEDCMQVMACLRQNRMVTLTGTGGVGKTRLAIRIAEEMSEGFHDGVWFVDLSTLSSTADMRRVAVEVINTLKLRETPGRDPLANLVEYLEHKALLLVLDNCEHLLKSTSGLVYAILERCSGLRILATSRESIGLFGEICWYVASLPVPVPALFPPDRTQWIEFANTFPSVILFVERATASNRTFALTNDNVRNVINICRRLDGIPLALVLAAARVQSMGIVQLEQNLDDLFSPYAGGASTLPGRHETLHALVGWSYRLLQEVERKVLMRLAVFRGGCTVEAVEAVCADVTVPVWEIRKILAELVRKSLIVLEEHASAVRYYLLETVRQYCLDRLQATGEQIEIQHRHQQHFTVIAEQAEPQLRGAAQLLWVQRLEADNNNFRAALEKVCTPEESEMGLRMAGALWHFWEMQGYYAEGYEWLQAALQNRTAMGLPRARALIVLAVLADDFCEATKVISHVKEGLHLAQGAGSRWWSSYAFFLLGWTHRPTDPEKATTYMLEAVALAREEGDAWLQAATMSALGYHELYLNSVASARQRFQEAIEWASKAQDMWMLEELTYHLGLTACAEGNYESALRHFSESLDMQKQMGSKTRTATARYFKAHVLFQLEQWEEARHLLHETLQIAQEFGTVRSIMGAFQTLACVSMRNGQPERAAVLFGAAASLAQTIDTSLLPVWNEEYARYEAEVHEALGHMFIVLRTRGQTMSLDQSIHFALQ